MTKRKLNNIRKVVFICGAPHSGSTLLGLILGSHSHCFYAGEANKVKYLNINNNHPDRYCKICGPECPIWGDFVYSENLNLYQYLSEKTGKSIIIDSTKKLDWTTTQMSRLENTKIKVYLIYLLRDGRAVINSRLRKYKESDPSKIIEDWINHMKNTNKYFTDFPHQKIKIRYEELASNSENIIKQLCRFLKIKYEQPMLRYYNYEHHPLGGNTGTQSLITKAQDENIQKKYIQLGERNEYYYSEHPLSIKLDLRWMDELDPKIQELFEKKAGKINKPMKWDLKKK